MIQTLSLLVLQMAQRFRVPFQAILTTQFVPPPKNLPSLPSFSQDQLHQTTFEIFELQTSEEKEDGTLSIKS